MNYYSASFKLPMPPSGNRYWRHLPNRSKPVLSSDAKAYRRVVKKMIMSDIAGKPWAKNYPLTKRLFLLAQFVFQDKRIRDLDNYQKQLLDAIKHAGIYNDDSQIDAIYAYRRIQSSFDPYITVAIAEMGDKRGCEPDCISGLFNMFMTIDKHYEESAHDPMQNM